ncbi:MAG: short-chain fatty acid transporter [Firmicutes bacterium HGW-Firmicutes-12]|nr:MAG: short-chain fatty acid transporter [Firmicutes bacterium HGW-Firmicutes-12]
MKKFTKFCVTLVQKYLPDPYLFAVILTFIVFLLGLGIAKNSPLQMVLHWGNGFWSLLAFAMQMALVLVTGHTLASSPPFKKLLGAIAGAMKNPSQAIMTTVIVAIIASWVNWGFGLVIGALLAKEMARKVKGLDYPLVIAAGYIGFMVWHAGFSGSIPLTIATAGHFLEGTIGIVPTSETIFAMFNVIPIILLMITLPILTKSMMPDDDKIIAIDPALLVDTEAAATLDKASMTPADRMENSPILSWITGLLGMVYIVWYFATKGFSLNLNIVNFLFLFLAILFHGTPRKFLDALTLAAKGTGGIILQFPFYAGIMGMMTQSGLAAIMSNWFVSISNPTTFPLFSFLSAGLVNLFVPSGGGQWAVQAPIMIPAGAELGVSTAKTAMSIAWGDAWTNMIQPFWALPALGIAGLNARDIMGYCVVAMLFGGVIIGLCLMFL